MVAEFYGKARFNLMIMSIVKTFAEVVRSQQDWRELRSKREGFPHGLVIKNPPAGDTFDPWSGEIPHASEKLSLCITTIGTEL